MKPLILTLITLILVSSAYAGNMTMIHLVGADKIGENVTQGVVLNLYVEMKEGNGRVFVDTFPLTKMDTQASARMAKEVACNAMSLDCSKYDFFYILSSDYPSLGGPSAGAAMTIATMAAIQGVDINQDVFITGTINPSGSIGPVGSILEKAEAAYKNGASIFLIPKGNYNVIINNETIDIREKALKDWNLHIIEVDDIYEAYKYATNYEISKKVVSSEEITSKRFNDAMQYLSDSLISKAKEETSRLERKFQLSSLPIKYSDPIKEKLTQAKEELDEAKSLYKSDQYYSAASYSVRALIYSNYASNLLDFHENDDSKDYVMKEILNVNDEISSFEKMFIKNYTIDCIDDIEVYAVVIGRIMEAEDLMNSSREAYEKGDYESALYLLSFAQVRKNTAYEWLTLTNEFSGNQSAVFSQDNLKVLSQERIAQSKDYLNYANYLTSSSLLKEAENHLLKAEEAYSKGQYVFALFEAAYARSKVSLTLKLNTLKEISLEDIYSSHEQDAKIAIKKAEEQGLLPILALSYLEYAGSFYKSDPLVSLIYLSYSEEMAKISQDLYSAFTGKYISNLPSINVQKFYETSTKTEKESIVKSVALIVSGVLAGIGLSFAFYETSKKFKKK